jgi:hypothetical protein
MWCVRRKIWTQQQQQQQRARRRDLGNHAREVEGGTVADAREAKTSDEKDADFAEP